MKIFYNVKGQTRKSLVAAISQELNTPSKYLGAPSFVFQVGGYYIDMIGTVTGKDNLDLEDALHQKGFSAVVSEYDEPDAYESGFGEMGATPTIEGLQDEAEVWAERMCRLKLENENVPDYPNRGQFGGDNTPEFEDLQMTEEEEQGLGRKPYEDWQGENGMQADDCILDESDTLTIEIPLDGFTEDSIVNLEKLIASKSGLIKKALGVSALPIERTETTLSFPWFAFGTPGEDVAAYARFIGALCSAAKKQQRVTAKEYQVDNEKFAFRVFLIRLGFVGDGYKAARKILLRNLAGNSAFKTLPSVDEEAHDDD